MKYSIYVLTFVMVVAVGCMNESPVAIDTGDSSPELIPGTPKTAPFHASFETTFTEFVGFPIVEFTIFYTGNATHIGEVSGEGLSFACFDFVNGCGEFGPPGWQTATVTFTGDEGDTIEMFAEGPSGPGEAPTDVIFSGTWEITGGTGRFSTASGIGTYAGSADGITQAGHVDFDGVISR